MAAPELGEPLLSPEVVAEFLGCSRSSVLDLFQKKRLRGVKVNSRVVRFRREDVQAFVDAALAESAPPAPRLVDQLPRTPVRARRNVRRAG